MKKYIITLSLSFTACGAETPLQTAAQNLPPVNSAQSPVSCEVPKVDGWCHENAWWKPANGGCQLKAAHDPTKPNKRLVMMQPKIITALTIFSCSSQTTNGYMDWQLIDTQAQDVNQYILNALYTSQTSAILDGDKDYLKGRFWYETHADQSEHRLFEISPFMHGTVLPMGTPVNPLEQSPAFVNYLVCFRFVDVE